MNIPDFVLPPKIGQLSALLPAWPGDQLFVATFNLGIRLGLLPEDALAALEGRTFGFDVLDLRRSVAVTCLNGRFLRAETPSAELMIRANTAQFLQLLNRQEDPDTLFFNQTLVVEGDTELGLILKNLLDSLDLSLLTSLIMAKLCSVAPVNR